MLVQPTKDVDHAQDPTDDLKESGQLVPGAMSAQARGWADRLDAAAELHQDARSTPIAADTVAGVRAVGDQLDDAAGGAHHSVGRLTRRASRRTSMHRARLTASLRYPHWMA